MDLVTNLLSRLGWERLTVLRAAKDDRDGYDKPVYQRGDWKALVGKLWVTVWRLRVEGEIAEMESFRTDDIELVESALRGAQAGTFAELCGT